MEIWMFEDTFKMILEIDVKLRSNIEPVIYSVCRLLIFVDIIS